MHYQDTIIETIKHQYGNARTNQNLYMDGGAIMDFALEVVPKTVEQILAKTSLTKEEIDYYVFHQANKFMLKSLQMLCGLTDRPFWNDCAEYGNTVSSSIPVVLVDLMKELQKRGEEQELKRVMLIGFGVGLSWSGCVVDMRRCLANVLGRQNRK